MSRAVPGFIANRLSRGELHGFLDGSVLHVDVTGFTSLTERLMADGHRGAERLSTALNVIFRSVQAPIYEAGGFIATFAGDSFTAVFPGLDTGGSAPVAERVRGLLSGLEPEAGFRPEYRFCLSAGEMEWGISGGTGMRAYFFRGRPVFACSALAGSARPGELAVDDGGRVPTGAEGGGGTAPPDLDAAFLTREALSVPGEGEFREVVSVFTGFDQEIPYGELDGLIRLLLSAAEGLGGYIPGVFFDDKGGNVLTVFGAPIAMENPGRRAVEYVASLTAPAHLGVRFGVCRGTVYAGRIGSERRFTYSVIGDPVNTAAKLLNHCTSGEALFAGRMLAGDGSAGVLRPRGSVDLAGKSGPVPVLTLGPKPRSGRPEVIAAGKLFGRRRQLRRCLDALRDARERSGPAVVHILGPAGAGKSRLCSEVTARASARWRRLAIRCDPISRRGMKPVAEMLGRRLLTADTLRGGEAFEDRLSSLLADLSASGADGAAGTAEELDRGRPALRRLIGLPSKDPVFDALEPAQRYSNTVFAVKACLKAVSLLSPLLLLVEDLHWADPDTLEVLRTLLRRLKGFPIALLVTARPQDDGGYPLLGVPEGIPSLRIELEGLPPEAAAALVEARTGGRPSARLLKFLDRRCRGNPFYLEQYCAYLTDRRALRPSPDGLVPCAAAAGMPEGIRSTLLARLDRLPPGLRGLVQTASVLGGEFDVEVLRKMRPGPEVPALLAAGTGLGIWAAEGGRFTFSHVLIRDAAYEMQLDRNLRRLHLSAAEAIDGLHGSDPESWSRIAGHLERAGRPGEAAGYLLRAARHAAGEYRSSEALELYDRYLACSPDGRGRAGVLRELASICVVLGKWKRAEDTYREAVREAGSALEATSVRVEMAGFLRRASRNEEACRMLEETEAEAHAAGGRLAAEHMLKLSRVRMDMGEYGEGLRLAERARGIFVRLGLSASAVGAGRAMGASLAARGDYAGALRAYSRALRMMEDSPDPHARAELLGSMGNVHLELEDLRRAEELYTRSLELAERSGHRQYVGFATGNLGIIHQLQGRLERSEELLRRQEAIGEERGDRYTMATAWINLCSVEVGRGRFPQALGLAERAERVFEEIGDRPGASYCQYMSGSLLALLRRSRAGEERLRRAVSIARDCGMARYLVDYLTALAWVLAEGDDPPGAAAAAAEAAETAGEIGMESRAVLAGAAGEVAAAAAGGEADVDGLRRLAGEGSDTERAVALYALYLISGDRAHAEAARGILKAKKGPLETPDWRVLAGTGGPLAKGEACR